MVEPSVIFADNHLLVINKPAGMPSQGDPTGDLSLLDWGKDYLKRTYKKPGNVYLGLVHRLDRPVSGVMVFARTSKGAGRLSEAFRDRSVRKIYRAIVEQTPPAAEGKLQHWLRPISGSVKATQVFDSEQPRTQVAILSYKVCGRHELGTVLEIELETGRKHQIRAQLAHLGCPIVGDRRYGAKRRFHERNIALHAYALTVPHPISGQAVTYTAPEPWN